MRFVFLLGAIAVLVLSSTNEEGIVGHSETKILQRGVRGAQGMEGVRKSVNKKRNGNAQRRLRKETDQKKRRKTKGGRRGLRRLERRYKAEKIKQTSRNKKEKTTKLKFRKNRQKTRQNDPSDPDRSCMTKTESRLYRKAVNELRKAKRIERWFNSNKKKVEKAKTLFNDAANFFGNCNIAEAAEIYKFLRKCNETASKICDPTAIEGDLTSQVKPVLDNAQDKIKSIDACIQDGSTCETCKFDSSNITDWNLSSIENTIKSTKDNCNDPKLEGSFAFCTKYLKESYDITLACMTSQACSPNTPTPSCAPENGPCADVNALCCGGQTCQPNPNDYSGGFLCQALPTTTTSPACAADNSSTTPTTGCSTFFDPSSGFIRDYRYAKNQLQKAERVKKLYKELEKKSIRSSTFFDDGSSFFKDCSSAASIYSTLSKCNETAKAACDPSGVLSQANFATLYAEVDACITNLTETLSSSDECLKATCNTALCAYKPIGIGNCDYRDFEPAISQLNKACNNEDESGTFAACTKLLKESYVTAKDCCSGVPTTITKKPSRLRLKGFKSWQMVN